MKREEELLTKDFLIEGKLSQIEKELEEEFPLEELKKSYYEVRDKLRSEMIPVDYLGDGILFEDVVDFDASDPEKVVIHVKVRKINDVYRETNPEEKRKLFSEKIAQTEFFNKLFYTKREPCIFETDVSEEPEHKDAIDWSEFVENLKKKNSDLSGIKGKEILEEVSKMFENRCENIVKDPIKGKLRFYNKKKDN